MSVETLPEIARVEMSTRTHLPGGLGGPVGGFSNDSNGAKATTAAMAKKPPPGPPTPPGKLGLWKLLLELFLGGVSN